ncbi:MAG: flagellar hook-length control protein FliK [Sulfitobacter sp.]
MNTPTTLKGPAAATPAVHMARSQPEKDAAQPSSGRDDIPDFAAVLDGSNKPAKEMKTASNSSAAEAATDPKLVTDSVEAELAIPFESASIKSTHGKQIDIAQQATPSGSSPLKFGSEENSLPAAISSAVSQPPASLVHAQEPNGRTAVSRISPVDIMGANAVFQTVGRELATSPSPLAETASLQSANAVDGIEKQPRNSGLHSLILEGQKGQPTSATLPIKGEFSIEHSASSKPEAQISSQEQPVAAASKLSTHATVARNMLLETTLAAEETARGEVKLNTPAQFGDPAKAPQQPALAVEQLKTAAPNIPVHGGHALGSQEAAQSRRIEGQISTLQGHEALDTFSWDSTRPVTHTGQSTALPRGDLAPHITRQIADHIAHAAHRPVEIALSPQELGRVRMSITANDGTITVNILAERAETLDLMRRNIDQLGQSFRDMGYDKINFAFGQGAHSGGQTDNQNNSNADQGQSLNALSTEHENPQPSADNPTLILLDRAQSTGVDIRL